LWSISAACLCTFITAGANNAQHHILTSRKAKRFFTAAKSFFGSFAVAFSNLKNGKYRSEQILHNLLI